MDAIVGEAQGQPGWLKPWFDFWIRFQHPYAMPMAWLVAVLETLIAVALIAGFARKLTYCAAIAFSLLIWLIYALVTGVIGRGRQPERGEERGDDARRILDERLARGEIDLDAQEGMAGAFTIK